MSNTDAGTAPVDDTAVAADWFTQGAAACSPGTTLDGAAPPQGTQLQCVDEQHIANGPAAWWDGEGHLVSVGRNVAGQRQGHFVAFYPDGNKVREGSYLHGHRHGVWTEWHPNGQVFSVGSYVDDRPDGVHRFTAADGHELGTMTMKLGTGRLVYWDMAGYKSEEYDYVDGLAHGDWVAWHPDGVKRAEGRWARGQPFGEHFAYDEQGRKRAAEHYRGGERDGTWTRWDEQGRVLELDRFDAGEQILEMPYQDGKPLAPLPKPTDCDTKAGLDRVAKREGRCVDRVPRVPGLVLLGSFAYDRGCMPAGYLWDCEEHTGPLRPEDVLARAGWGAARGELKEKLALEYVRAVHYAYEGSISWEPEPPHAMVAADGSAVVTAWLADPSGMQPGWTRHLVEVHISASGAVEQKELRTETGGRD